MEYFFVIGRNPQLSLIEIDSYAKREGNSVLSHFQDKNSAIVDFSSPLEKNAVNKLGGTISIGQVLIKGKLKEILNFLEKQNIYLGTKKNFSYVLLNFADEDSLEKISSYLKKRFKSEKLKASEKNARREIIMQDGEKISIVYSGSLINEQYFLFKEKEDLYFGRIIQKCDYEKIEKRDMQKPVRREAFSISPRLAKIMINLSEVKKGEKLLDPFCGIGVILQEALLQEIESIGVDSDSKAISGAKENLEWFGFSKQNYTLLRGDSTSMNLLESNVFVAEPDFGEALKKIPSVEKARQMQNNFEKLMISVLNNFKKKVIGRFVFTAPLINLGKKRLPCNIQDILRKTGLKLVEGFPIAEFRQSQIVGREIYVLEK
jgi:tRNA G10  N-methylase Trm11